MSKFLEIRTESTTGIVGKKGEFVNFELLTKIEAIVKTIQFNDVWAINALEEFQKMSVESEENIFKDEKFDNLNWTDLKESTIKHKKGASHKILEEDRNLKNTVTNENNFIIKKEGNDHVLYFNENAFVENGRHFWKALQYGYDFGNRVLPGRPFLGITKELKENMRRKLQDKIDFLLKNGEEAMDIFASSNKQGYKNAR